MTKQRKQQLAAYIQYQLKRKGLSQRELAQGYGCSQSAISGVIKSKPGYLGLVTIRQYIATRLEHESWQELCAEALTQEAVGA